MQATKRLSSAGQSIWLDNITRDLLETGTLEQYIRDLSVTGLTSNPTIFDEALRHGTACDTAFVTSWKDLLGVIASKTAAAGMELTS